MYPPHSQQELQQLPDVISAPRFATYLVARGNDTARALALYRWNLEISAAFMGPLHLCEIAVRNGVSEGIAAVHGASWPRTHGFVVSIPSPRQGYDPRRDLTLQAASHHTTGKIIADLKFAFWERMLTRRFDRSIWQPQFFLIFPGTPQALSVRAARESYRGDLEQVRRLRNRIAHHEPIFARNLQDDLDRVKRLIEWRNPVAANWLSSIETVSFLLARQP